MGTKNNTSNLFILIRKWKLIGHYIKIQNKRICTTALTWHPEGRRKIQHDTKIQIKNITA